jgi:cytochrome b subunit of formate dehydrogenase
MSVSRFSTLFKEDAAGAVTSLLRGLNEMDGTDAILALDAMGIKGARLTDAMLRSAGAVDLMEGALTTANTAYKENTALAAEAEVRYKSFASQLKNLWAQVKLLGAEIFKIMEPSLRILIDATKSTVQWFANLDDGTKTLIVVTAATVAAIGPLLVAFGAILGFVPLILSGWAAMTGALTAMAATSAIATVGLLALQTAGLAIAAMFIGHLARSAYAANSAIVELNANLKESKRLENELLSRRQKETDNILKEAGALEGGAKKEFLTDEIKRAHKEIAGYNASIAGTRKQIDKMDTAWNKMTGNKILEGKQQELAETERSLGALRDRLAALNEEASRSEKIVEKAGAPAAFATVGQGDDAMAKAMQAGPNRHSGYEQPGNIHQIA